ncbi:ABC transporter ATP-binding protein uup [Novipirellula aureliae]|uniref:ATP-binding protein Uup n=1 Tax=Novipirellula aureliae TaxID=2527966 RepID=A0A5C6DVJ2_9BACT|nr:ATP-binding cassette domain-containing protein [Novipirellula aureliae]TWU41393.1 ABC transporter ATP-binding protein uup [Novipirellula aureliae]
MNLLSLDDLTIGFRGPSLLDSVSAKIDSGQRIGLLGRNGAGKTTLMRMLTGDVVPDHGSITIRPGTVITRLSQNVPRGWTGTVRTIVLGDDYDPHDHDEAWKLEHAVDSTLSRMELDPDIEFETLSSGMKRRVLLAKAISRSPDLLLLDEPTNHLDIESIVWLENFLSRWEKTLLFVTHDRSFLQNLAKRIWEIDRGRLFDWSCDYKTFLERKEQLLAAEEKQNALFDKKLAEEEAWIRQGIKARRTRNEGRVRALEAMRLVRGERRKNEGKAKLNLQDAQRSGALVAELKHVSFAYGERPIMNDFSTTIMRGDKLGIIGPNGVGKSTLLKLLLGKLEPNEGKVRLGTNLSIAYFDQLRDTLDPEKTVEENVGDGSDRIQIGDKTKHIIGYLQDFLFTPERVRTQVKFLSGGERNRVLLAKLMTQPANVIVLDEPTNDLDAETLEMLEDELVEFAGTVLMVSHDRTFLNNVVSSTIVFEEDGVNEYVGGYDDWRATIERRKASESEPEAKKNKPKLASKSNNDKAADSVKPPAKKLSFKEKFELEKLPAKIETLEQEIESLHQTMADPTFYQQAGPEIAVVNSKLSRAEDELAKAFARWEELEG